MAKQGAQNRTTARQQARQRARVEARAAARRRARRQRHWWVRHRGLSILSVLVVLVAGVVGIRLGIGSGSGPGATGSHGLAAVGAPAPNFRFTTTSGTPETVASLHGHPTLLWFVATWCSSCQAGTEFLAQQGMASLRAAGVRVVELELYDDLGQSGPTIAQFEHAFASRSTSADWLWGNASRAMSERYDPKAYLDIYYLLGRNGHIRYVNSSPASTFSELPSAVERTVTPSSAAPAGHASSTTGVTLAPSVMVNAVTRVPPRIADDVGLPSAVFAPPKRLSGQSPLAEDGKPAVIYVGAEFCPFCAAERWAAVMALSRFGTFTDLGETHSSTSDVYPGTVTFSFYGSHYTSPYLIFDPTETETDIPAPGGGYTTLQPLRGLAKRIFAKYDAPPFVPASSEGSIPFYDLGNKVLVSGASYSPQVLQGLSAQQISADLSNPASPVTQSIVGTANYLTAGICSITSGQPASVCQHPYVAKAAQAMGVAIP